MIERWFNLTLTADAAALYASTDTVWDASRPEHDKRGPVLVEWRRASFVGPEKLEQLWGVLGEESIRVVDEGSLLEFLALGGHGLIHEAVAKTHLPWLLGSRQCLRYDSSSCYVALEPLPAGADERFARGATRERVMARDEFRCAACGRGTEDGLDVKLHVHHITEASESGLTIDQNLITLCETCHDAIDPMSWRWRDEMYEKIARRDARHHRRLHAEGVARYRDRVRSLLPTKHRRDPATAPSPITQRYGADAHRADGDRTFWLRILQANRLTFAINSTEIRKSGRQIAARLG
jgi:hypothetical protein